MAGLPRRAILVAGSCSQLRVGKPAPALHCSPSVYLPKIWDFQRKMPTYPEETSRTECSVDTSAGARRQNQLDKPVRRYLGKHRPFCVFSNQRNYRFPHIEGCREADRLPFLMDQQHVMGGGSDSVKVILGKCKPVLVCYTGLSPSLCTNTYSI